MSIVMICPHRDTQPWLEAFKQQAPDLKVEVWPEIADPATVEFAACWNQPSGILKQYPNLKCISSLGAGVNHLLNDETRPPDVPLVRLVDKDLKQSMAEYVVLAALGCFRHAAEYRRQQQEHIWQPLAIPHISETTVGIMGYGQIGQHVARHLRSLGFQVCGWNRHPKEVDTGTVLFSGARELNTFLRQVNILVCLLPLTPATENILDLQLFKQLPTGASLINVGRGKHLVDADLLTVLDEGHLAEAIIDVFREEPLPADHPFWTHEKITVTPHIASVTNPVSAVRQILENYQRAKNGRPLLNQVDVCAGY